MNDYNKPVDRMNTEDTAEDPTPLYIFIKREDQKDYFYAYNVLDCLGIGAYFWDEVLKSVDPNHALFESDGIPHWIDAAGVASLLLTNTTVIDEADITVRQWLLRLCEPRVGARALLAISNGDFT